MSLFKEGGAFPGTGGPFDEARPVQGSQFIQVGGLFRGKPFQGGRPSKGGQRPKAAPISSSDANPREAMPSRGQGPVR